VGNTSTQFPQKMQTPKIELRVTQLLSCCLVCLFIAQSTTGRLIGHTPHTHSQKRGTCRIEVDPAPVTSDGEFRFS